MGKRILIFILLVLGITSFFYFDISQYLTLENLKSRREDLNNIYIENPVAMIFGFIGIYIFIGLLMLPGATFLSFCAGVIFGSSLGPLVVNIGSTLGATLAFLVARYLLRNLVEKSFADKLNSFNDHFCENAIRCVLFFRLVPLFPFFVVNIALSLTKVPLKKFVLGTMFGTLPATFVYTNAGRNLAYINSFSEIMSVRVLGSLTLLGIFVLIPIIYRTVRKMKGPSAIQ